MQADLGADTFGCRWIADHWHGGDVSARCAMPSILEPEGIRHQERRRIAPERRMSYPPVALMPCPEVVSQAAVMKKTSSERPHSSRPLLVRQLIQNTHLLW